MPGRTTVRSDLERRPVRVPLPALDSRLRGNDGGSRLRIPVCAERCGCVRWPRPLRRGDEGHGGTLSVWLAYDCRSPQYPPHPSATATTVFVTGFSAAFRPSSQTSFSGLWRDTAGGSCVGDPVLPRSPPHFIQLFLLRLKRLHALRLDAAILRFRCAAPMMVGSAPACCCNTCVVVLSSFV